MFEGEESGDVAEGVGAAIGGPGVERYKIEEVATTHKIPTRALITKMSRKEAISEIKPNLKESVDKIVYRLHRIIEHDVREGDTVIIAGIGNTLGVT